MRRLAVWSLAPVVVAAVALGGCDAKGGGTPTAAGTPGAVASSDAAGPLDASASATSSDASPDATMANTRQVCATVNKAIADGSAAFASDLGTFAGHLAGGNKTQADKAKADAIAQLNTMATKIRSAGDSALDPRVQDGARRTAAQISALASNSGLLANVKSASDLAGVIEKLTRASDAMNSVCV